MKRRHQSQTERDEAGLARLRERKQVITPPGGVHVGPEDFDFENATDQFEGDQLTAARTLRAEHDPAGRIVLLEAGQRELTGAVAEIRVSVADIRGDQKAAAVSLRAIEKAVEQNATREHIKFTAEVDVGTAERKDAIDARKARRELWFKLAGAVITGGVVMKLLQALL